MEALNLVTFRHGRIGQMCGRGRNDVITFANILLKIIESTLHYNVLFMVDHFNSRFFLEVENLVKQKKTGRVKQV